MVTVVNKEGARWLDMNNDIPTQSKDILNYVAGIIAATTSLPYSALSNEQRQQKFIK